MRIKGMGKGYVGLLREVGVIPCGNSNIAIPAKLAKAMAEANKKRKLVRFLPSEKLVVRWVEHAKKLPLQDHLLNPLQSSHSVDRSPLDTGRRAAQSHAHGRPRMPPPYRPADHDTA